MAIEEQFILLAIGLAMIILRMVVRWQTVKWQWQLDDYLMPLTGVSEIYSCGYGPLTVPAGLYHGSRRCVSRRGKIRRPHQQLYDGRSTLESRPDIERIFQPPVGIQNTGHWMVLLRPYTVAAQVLRQLFLLKANVCKSVALIVRRG